jgi:hypothetical protein
MSDVKSWTKYASVILLAIASTTSVAGNSDCCDNTKGKCEKEKCESDPIVGQYAGSHLPGNTNPVDAVANLGGTGTLNEASGLGSNDFFPTGSVAFSSFTWRNKGCGHYNIKILELIGIGSPFPGNPSLGAFPTGNFIRIIYETDAVLSHHGKVLDLAPGTANIYNADENPPTTVINTAPVPEIKLFKISKP